MRFANSANSEECSKSELDIFTIPPTQTVIEEGVWDTIYTHPNFRNSVNIRFDIPGTNSHYTDISQTDFHLKVKLEKITFTPLKTKDLKDDYKCGVVNNLLHSLFEQIQVNLNNQEIEKTNKTYPYRAYLENLLTYDNEFKNTF